MSDKFQKDQVWWAAVNPSGLALPSTFAAERHHAESKMMEELCYDAELLVSDVGKPLELEELRESRRQATEWFKEFRFVRVRVTEVKGEDE